MIVRDANGFPVGLAQVAETVVVQPAELLGAALHDQAELLQAVRADANKWRKLLVLLQKLSECHQVTNNTISIDSEWEMVVTLDKVEIFHKDT